MPLVRAVQSRDRADRRIGRNGTEGRFATPSGIPTLTPVVVMLNVLLIDDSAVIRKMLRRVLGDHALGVTEVFEAADGQEGLAVLARVEVQLVLCDVNMPVMDGLEFLQELRKQEDRRTIPVLMVTTESGQESVFKALQLGARGYVRKPFTPDEVKQKVVECLKPILV